MIQLTERIFKTGSLNLFMIVKFSFDVLF